MKPWILKIALDTPLDKYFDYRWIPPTPDANLPQPGQLAIVPFAGREMTGMITGIASHTDVPFEKLKNVLAVRTHIAPLSAHWIALCHFAADYYQRPFGEVAIPGLPKYLRAIKSISLERALKKTEKTEKTEKTPKAFMTDAISAVARPSLNQAQQAAAETIVKAQGFTPILLYGVTGSGKTEVYLQAAAQILRDEAAAQILILVPEINLTPQFEAHICAHFPEVAVATLHSGLAEGARLAHWLAAHSGHARIVLGTRLAILASLPSLRLIVVDEEHDPSYKQREGLHYSARDLAVWRAHQLAIPIVLGSATPSLETWQHAQSNRYRMLPLRERAVKDAVLPTVRVIDMEKEKPVEGITPALADALKRRLQCGEQSLLFLNRRGYAPVIACDACGWLSHCVRCTALMVLHISDRRLRCHHCSFERLVPRSCPTCGNIDLQPLGRGTQRIEESLRHLFPHARVMRIDADSTRLKGSAQAAFDAVHRGDVDILIGTQMVAKGHDFRHLTLVGVLNPDTALFSQDYRAAERLFAQLMQVAGRAGRAAQKEGGNASEVLIQTRYPQHPLYAAVMAHDYDNYAALLLQERRQAGLPPFMYQALLRAEAKELRMALSFLEMAVETAAQCIVHAGITVNDPVPMTMTRVANVERAQLLVESPSRPALQTFLKTWMAALRAIKTRAKWSLEVDPMDI